MPTHHEAAIVTKDGNQVVVRSPTPTDTRARLHTVRAEPRHEAGASMTAADVARVIVHLHRILGTMVPKPAHAIRKAHIREFPGDYPETQGKAP